MGSPRKETQYFRPKNWEKFQHYKTRQPPWIKLHRQLLRDHEFNRLTLIQQIGLVKIWLLYADCGRPLPLVSSWCGASLGMRSQDCGRVLDILLSSGFIELCDKDASTMLASCKQNASLETETETETEKNVGAEAPINGHQVTDLDALFYREGKAVLGDKSGGVLTKLKRKCGDLQEANRILREASGKGDPMEYVQGVLRRKPAKSKGWAI